MNFWPLWPLDDLWGHTKYTPPGMVVTKFHQNLFKCVEEETNCQKKKQQEPSKLSSATLLKERKKERKKERNRKEVLS